MISSYLGRKASYSMSDTEKGGERHFLEHASVIQAVVLPLLSAADVFRLGRTCKAVLQWITAASPQYLKVGCG